MQDLWNANLRLENPPQLRTLSASLNHFLIIILVLLWLKTLKTCDYINSNMALRFDGRVVVVTGAGRGTVFNSSS